MEIPFKMLSFSIASLKTEQNRPKFVFGLP
jgi:hypothetical protein